MPEEIAALSRIADRFDAIVFDQWGVLHDGSTPYPGVPDTLKRLAEDGRRMAVLSNSGKRADVNADRIASLGYRDIPFEIVMTSGEAFWRDVADGVHTPGTLCPICAAPGDAERWAEGLDIRFGAVEEADAVLLMGLPEGSSGNAEQELLSRAGDRNLPLYCTNPDRLSPRPGGALQVSPGALAHASADAGGAVTFYGKPHRAIFDTLARTLDVAPDRLLIVGDSLEHDIAGGAGAGWATLFISGGLARGQLVTAASIAEEARRMGTPVPDYFMPIVR